MPVRDIEIAKNELKGSVSLAIACGGKVIFTSGSYGVSGIIEALGTLGKDISGASAADAVVGKAVALLFGFAGISDVYGGIMSGEAARTFEKAGIGFSYDTMVPRILNKRGDGPCPLEEKAENFDSGKDFYDSIAAGRKEAKGC